ncbi:MAG: transcriptional regulator [Ignavibacteriae bacterium]|nr:transcriptional regulator [Ignavibacteriota bacterium]
MNLEKIKLEDDKHLFCVTAKSFPDGILEAHQTLHKQISFKKNRNYYEFSYMNPEHQIIYKAAAEELESGEFGNINLETFKIKKGNYNSITVKDYEQNIPKIKEAFDELKKNPNIDPNGVALEWYSDGPDCKCMIRLKDNFKNLNKRIIKWQIQK